jgi:CDP-diglyceride synthetase
MYWHRNFWEVLLCALLLFHAGILSIRLLRTGSSRIERFSNVFGFLLCLTGAADVLYWHRNAWEWLLVPVLMVVAGNLFARLFGMFKRLQG